MSEDDYKQLIERILRNPANLMIATDTGIEAARKIGQLAAQEEAQWAVAGGLAMHLYGSPRLTKDVDIIASRHLSLTPVHRQTMIDRATVKQKVVETAGEDAWLAMLSGFRRLCDLADGRTTEPSKYYDQD